MRNLRILLGLLLFAFGLPWIASVTLPRLISDLRYANVLAPTSIARLSHVSCTYIDAVLFSGCDIEVIDGGTGARRVLHDYQVGPALPGTYELLAYRDDPATLTTNLSVKRLAARLMAAGLGYLFAAFLLTAIMLGTWRLANGQPPRPVGSRARRY